MDNNKLMDGFKLYGLECVDETTAGGQPIVNFMAVRDIPAFGTRAGTSVVIHPKHLKVVLAVLKESAVA